MKLCARSLRPALVALALGLAFGLPLRTGLRVSPAYAEGETPSVRDLEARVAALRGELERLYEGAQRDHARVRAEGFAGAVSTAPFADWVAAAVRAARDDADADEATVADAVMASLPAAGTLPLSAASVRVVLPTALAAARGSTDAEGAALFLLAAQEAFARDAFEDVWDTLFQAHPQVRAFRESGAALEAARAAAADGGGDPADAIGEPPLSTMVRFGRMPSLVGPWEGMTSDIDEKDNQRTKIRINGFYMDLHEVTCGQYLAFLLTVRKRKRKLLLPGGWTLDDEGAPVLPEGAARLPVTEVTYSQALAYAKSIGKRLPTEDEWEHAACGSEELARVYPWGADAKGRTWAHRAEKLGGPVPVDQFPDDVTPDGVRGMAGNVAELVATLTDRSNLGKGLPKAGASVTIRGGSFRAPPDECVTAWRWFTDPRTGDRHVGFRCVMDVGEYKRRSRNQK